MNTPSPLREKKRKRRARVCQSHFDATQLLADGATTQLASVLRAPDFDFESFEDYLWDHRLYNLAFEILDDDLLRSCVPRWFVGLLNEERVASTARGVCLLNCLDAIDQRFTAAGIDYWLLKGFAIAARCYPALDRRYQRDIDLFVRPNQVVRAAGELKACGLETRVSVTWPDVMNGTQILLRGHESKVELHWRLRNHKSYSINERRIWKGCTEVSVDGRPIPTFSDEHCLVGLLLSIAKDIGTATCRVKLFLDVYLMVMKRDEPFDWDAILGRCQSENIDRVCTAVLAMLCQLFRPNSRLATLDRCLASQPRACRMTRDETWELLQNPREDPRNRVWLQQLRPVTWSDHLRWTVRRTGSFLRYCPTAIPIAMFHKLQTIGSAPVSRDA